MSALPSRLAPAPHAKQRVTRYSAPNLASVFDSRSNSIGFLRFAFAATVLLNHSLILGGFASDDPLMFWSHGQISFASMAVDGFFVLSGYLITRSYLSSASPFRYLWRRVIRIFPGFWVCLLLTALVCAPLVLLHERGTLAGAGWLRGDESPLGYLVHNGLLTINQWNIWHLLASVPLTRMAANFGVDPGANGFDRSLWSLRYEWDAYLLVAVAGVLGVLSRLRIGVVVWTLFLGVSLLAVTLQPNWFDKLPKGLGMHAMFADDLRLRLWFLFALGALMYLYGRRIPMRLSYGLIAATLLVATLAIGGYAVFGRIAFAYVCVWLAVYLPIRNFEARGDFSYGLYIYGWLVAQMLAVYKLYELGPIVYVALAAILTFGCAFLSWHLVEAPAQRLKSLSLPRIRPLEGPLRWLAFDWLAFVTSRVSPER
jgi:peptidoglycan/LPS O-acetylase OafA/YrhL